MAKKRITKETMRKLEHIEDLQYKVQEMLGEIEKDEEVQALGAAVSALGGR